MMQHPFLSLTPSTPSAFPYALPVPETYQAWSLTAAKIGCSGLQVLHVLDMHKKSQPKETPLYLAEMITRTVFEAALVMHFDKIDNLMDVWMRARIQEYFGVALTAEALRLIEDTKLADLQPIRLMPVTEPDRPQCARMWVNHGIPERSRAQ